ncbi:MAG: hypothetical protein QOH21_1785 [Acidobacteriota bacterium]|jgi:hypothetical protein|nr:hypothetical protein [Acidobacteriota bacterium]
MHRSLRIVAVTAAFLSSGWSYFILNNPVGAGSYRGRGTRDIPARARDRETGNGSSC